MPNTPMSVVMDTAFHQTMPEEAYIYALPYEVYEENSVRRYGMHGTSHKFVSGVAAEMMGKNIEDLDRKSTRLNSSHANISYAVFCLKKKNIKCHEVRVYSGDHVGQPPRTPPSTLQISTLIRTNRSDRSLPKHSCRRIPPIRLVMLHA